MNHKLVKNILCILGALCLLKITLLCLVIVFLGWNRETTLSKLAGNLIENNYQASKHYDGLFLLMGNLEDRAQEAVKLYSARPHLEIYMIDSESSFIRTDLEVIREVDLYKLYLVKNEIPSTKIHIFKAPRISPSRSTKTEAENFLNLIRNNQITGKKFLLLTSWFHSRRALKIFNRLRDTDPELEFDIHTTPAPNPLSKWITEEKDFLVVFSEYLKWIHNFYLVLH